jgi:hypothetical protein
LDRAPLHHRPHLRDLGGAPRAHGRSRPRGIHEESHLQAPAIVISPAASWLAALALLAAPLASCKRDNPLPPAPRAEGVEKIDAALRRGAAFLWKAQRADGAFSSTTYGAFRDGRALSPLALSALLFAAERGEVSDRAYAKGADFVASLVGKDGRVGAGPHGLDYPVYSVAGALLVLAIPANRRHASAIPPMVAFIKARQLAEENGWTRADPAFGGFGYWHSIPKKPAGAEGAHELLSSNLSATLFAIGALRLAGVPASDPLFAKARAFVERCQNFAEAGAGDSRYDDGGFFLTPTNEVQNKAGAAGKDARGRVRYRSYASMTADGLRALLGLGLGPEHPRVRAAARWLASHFEGAEQSGRFPPDRAFAKEGSRYYTAWTVAHALAFLGAPDLATPKGKVSWAKRMVADLLAWQRPDGSWKNAATDLREDDPVLATSFALAALALCRYALTGEWRLSIQMR